MPSKLVFDRTRNNQDLYRPRKFIIVDSEKNKDFSGIAEMAPLQTTPGSYGEPEERVLLKIDRDFDLDTDNLDTVKEFSGISELNAITYDKNTYDMALNFLTLFDEAFGLPGEFNLPQCHVGKPVSGIYATDTESNKLDEIHTTKLDRHFKI